MTAMPIGELSISDVPSARITGTVKRRKIVYLRGLATATFTLNLNTTDSTIADVEGVLYETYGDAVAVTAITWSTSTLTFKDNAQFEGAFVVTLV